MRFKVIMAPLIVASTSLPIHAAGLTGVPSAITGISSSQGEASEQVGETSNQLSRYIVEQVKSAPIPKPQVGVKAARERERGDESPVQPVSEPVPVSASGQGSSQHASAGAVETPVQVPVRRVEYKLPEGMKEVKKNTLGSAKVNGDKPGTYVLRVPPFFFSTFKLPFSPKTEVPFPDHVVIRKQSGMLMIAPKTNIPVNLVLFHPQKPELSVSFVLIPDGSQIPATVDVSFDPSRLPQEAKTASTGEAGNRSLGIPTTLQTGDPRKASRFERSADHISTLESIHKLVSKGLVPDGFSLDVITEGATGALCGDRRLVGQFSQRMQGDQFVIDIFQVTNAHSDVLRFSEQNCYRQGVASVQFNPSRTLAPGQKAELIIVHARPNEDAPKQLRRPSLVGGSQ